MKFSEAAVMLALGLPLAGCDDPVVGTYYPRGVSLVEKMTFTSGGYVDVTALGLYNPAASKYVIDGNRVIVGGVDGERSVFILNGQGCITADGPFGGMYCKTPKSAAPPQQNVSPKIANRSDPTGNGTFQGATGLLHTPDQRGASSVQSNPASVDAPLAATDTGPSIASLSNVLSRLRESSSKQYKPSGEKSSDSTVSGIEVASLSSATRGAIGERLRECWTGDRGALDIDKQLVHLTVTTDATGTVRVANIAPNDASRNGSNFARASAERARRAVLDPQCARLPLPNALLGQSHTFAITFRP